MARVLGAPRGDAVVEKRSAISSLSDKSSPWSMSSSSAISGTTARDAKSPERLAKKDF